MKIRPTTYTFDASAQTIDCASFTSLEAIQLITNVTDNVIVYNFADPAKGGSLTDTTLTLVYDTSSMSDTDKLQILVETGSTTESVSGTVTANAGTNLNTSALALETGGNLASVKTNTDKIPALGQALAAASVPVVLTADQISTLTPPEAITGFATSAKQDTIIGHVDGVETLLGTIDADTSNISTKIDTIAGAVSGTEVQVDVLTMPTTTVQATNLDIRDLVNTDVVTAELSAVDNAVLDTIAAKDFATQTTLAALNAKMVTGTDIGDVTINNASGAAAVNIQDGGNTITVDGTVTANLSATDNAVLDQIELNQDSQTAILTTIDSDTDAIKTAVQLIDNAISGSEMQVDVVASLPAGTNAIGKLASNSGVDIGDVDVTSLPKCLQGPANPSIDSYTHASINLAAGANQVLVASAANKQIWVYGIGFTVNVAGTVSFQDQDDTAVSGVMNFAATSGMAINPSGNFSMPIWKLGTDKDLEVDIVTSELDGWLTYAIVSV